MGELGWVDWSLLAALAASVLLGAWRGLVFELMALVGWLVAYVAAQVFAAPLAAHLPVGTPGSALQHGLALALAFVGTLVAWGLLARLVRLLVHATPLTALDRLLGAGFGLVRGGVLLLVLATVVALTPAARAQAWQDSHGAVWLGVVLKGLRPALPAELARHLPP
jgi:membrane protein required for colicin V production